MDAWYAEDSIRITPNFRVILRFRDEFSPGWNEAHGRASISSRQIQFGLKLLW
jgi:hypothetical protein